MAITFITINPDGTSVFIGLSSDTPTAADTPITADILRPGSIIYDTDTDGIRRYNGSAWNQISTGSAAHFRLFSILSGILPEEQLYDLGTQTGAANTTFTVTDLETVGTLWATFISKEARASVSETWKAEFYVGSASDKATLVVPTRVDLVAVSGGPATIELPATDEANETTVTYLFTNLCAHKVTFTKSGATDNWELILTGSARA